MSFSNHQDLWPRRAAKLAQRVGPNWMHPVVAGHLASADRRRVLVAVSGGPDSVFLFCLLWAWAADLGIELVVAHYNHRWRGRLSDEDAAFVEAMAEGLGCVCETEARPEQQAAFTETTARALRLDFLRRMAAEHGCGMIALGHQQNDILETQIQRLVRGVSSDGMAAPRPVNTFGGKYPTHIRPVLNLRASDIRMELSFADVPWQEDSSNEDTSIARNALRQEIIPDLVTLLGRDVSAGAARSRMLLAEESAALDLLARERLADAFAGVAVLDRKALQLAPRALVRRALIGWLQAHALIHSLSAPAMDFLIESVYAEKEANRLSAGSAFVVLDEHRLLIERKDAAEEILELCSLETGAHAILSTGAVLETEWIAVDEALRAHITGGQVDPNKEAFLAVNNPQSLQIRPWQPGDRFRPLGAPGSKKLKDWFIDRHVPLKERKLLPVVMNEMGEILWVPGLPPADARRISSATTRALRLTYRIREPL